MTSVFLKNNDSFTKFIKSLNSEIKLNIITNKYNSTYGVKNSAFIIDNQTTSNFEILVPGYENNITEKEVSLEKVIGVLWLSSGKHKVFVNIDYNGFEKCLCLSDIKKYIDSFLNSNDDVRAVRTIKYQLIL